MSAATVTQGAQTADEPRRSGAGGAAATSDTAAPSSADLTAPQAGDESDPLPAPPISRTKWIQQVSMQSRLATVAFVILFVTGMTLTVLAEYKKPADEQDFGLLFGSLLIDQGVGCMIIGVWQYLNSTELALQSMKLWGIGIAAVLISAGVALRAQASSVVDTAEAVVGSLALSQSIGPVITTIFLLEPKEKETLAMPYINNFVRFVSQALPQDAAGNVFVLLVPDASFSAMCAFVHERVREYKFRGKFAELQLTAPGGFKKFSTMCRHLHGRAYFFDIPSMLQNATPRKLALFLGTLHEYLAQERKRGALLNVRVVHPANLTLHDIDAALQAAAAEGPYGTSAQAHRPLLQRALTSLRNVGRAPVRTIAAPAAAPAHAAGSPHRPAGAATEVVNPLHPNQRAVDWGAP